MKTSFSKHLILCFILTLPSSKPPHVEASVLQKLYYNMSIPRTWEYAKGRCSSNNNNEHLATIANENQARTVAGACGSLSICWIGLHKDEDSLDNWRWVDGKKYTEQHWTTGELDNKLGENSCAAIDRGEMFDDQCQKEYAYVCQINNLVLVKENKTWEDAIEHCRLFQTRSSSLMFDLLSLHTEEELAYVQGELGDTQTAEVWIGLRWLSHRWLWMDGRPEGGMPVCPVNGMNCGTLSETGKQARHCGEKRNFFCYERPEI